MVINKMRYLFIFFISTTWLFAQPKIKVVEGASFDFGDVFTGQKAERVLTIKNVGSDTLRITDVKAQCGCTATMISEKTLPPSAEGRLSIAFNTTQYGGTKVTKHIYISSNDTTNSKLTIEFGANVINVLDLAPRFFAFDKSKVDTAYTKVIVIKNPSKKPVKIISVDTKFEMVKIELLKNELGPGEQTELRVTLHPTKAGTYQESINMTTDNPVQPRFEIKIYAWVNRK